MGYPTKIATCCFCGSKAALRLDRGRHELTCASCGAPLRDLKMLPKRNTPKEAPADVVAPRRAAAIPYPEPRRKPAKPIKKKKRKSHKRKSWFKDAAEELFDFVEDIFD